MWHTSGRIKMGWIDGLMMSNLVSQCIHTPPCKCQFFTKFMWNRHLLILANRPSTTCCPVHLTQLIEGKHRLPFQRNKEESQDVKHMGRKKRPQTKKLYLLSAEGVFLGGSMRILGSHSPGGSTITSSRNSSMPAIRSSRSLALYATSLKSCG